MAQDDITKSVKAVINAMNSIDFSPEAFAMVFDEKASDAVTVRMFETLLAMCRQWASQVSVVGIDETDPFYNQAIYAMRILDALPSFDTSIATATSRGGARH